MRLSRTVFSVVILSTYLATTPALAGVYADDLGKCLVKSTSSEDRNALVTWMFAAAASHPAVKSIVSVTDTQRTEMDKNMAALFERLLTKSCLSEAQLAVKYEGQNVFASSFEILGKVAGQEMYSDPLVSKSMSNFTQYMDKKNVEKAFGATKK